MKKIIHELTIYFNCIFPKMNQMSEVPFFIINEHFMHFYQHTFSL